MSIPAALREVWREILGEIRKESRAAVAPFTTGGKLNLSSPHIVGTLPPERGGAVPGGEALPPGGATGQVLTKLSGTDGDADWVDPTGSATDAVDVAYDNAASGLAATDVQAAIDEVAALGGGGGGLVLLFATELTTAAASIDTGTLPTGYRNLHYQLTGRATGVTYANVGVRVNNDASAIYDNLGDYRGSGGTGGLNGTNANNYGAMVFGGTASNAADNSFVRGTIFDHEATDRRKMHNVRSFRAGHNIYADGIGTWRSNAAVTSIQVLETDGGGAVFQVGTRLVVWGEA